MAVVIAYNDFRLDLEPNRVIYCLKHTIISNKI